MTAKIEQINLKSNMDRFIGNAVKGIPDAILEFKIQYGQIYRIWLIKLMNMLTNLKSNMDRFIVSPLHDLDINPTFKIQYGQIYRIDGLQITLT